MQTKWQRKRMRRRRALSHVLYGLCAAASLLPIPVSRSQAASSSEADTGPPLRRALVIGVDSYQRGKNLTNLEAARRDAQAFGSLLTEKWGFSREDVTFLSDNGELGDFATAENLKEQIGSLTNSALVKPDSLIIFYFAGHGVRIDDEDYVIPMDRGPSDRDRLCSVNKLYTALESLNPRNAFLFIDACRHPPPVEARGVQRANPSGLPAGVPWPKALVALYACDANQESYEEPGENGYGLFTHYLLEGLKGEASNDGIITYQKLYEYVRGKVSSHASLRFGKTQVPTGRTPSGEVVILRVPRADAGGGEQRPGPDSLMFLVYRSIVEGPLEQAEILALRAVREYPTYARAYFALGRVYQEQGRFDEAYEPYRKAYGLDPKIPGLADRIQQVIDRRKGGRRPDLPQPQHRRLIAASSPGGNSGSQQAAAFRRRWPGPSVPTRNEGMREWYGDDSRAYQGALRADPDIRSAGVFAVARTKPGEMGPDSLDRARQLLAAGDLVQAQRLAFEAVLREPDNAGAHHLLARVYLQQQQYDDALRELQEALRIDPDLRPAKMDLAQVLQRKGPTEMARLVEQAERHLEQGRFVEAEALVRWALALAPDQGTAHLVLGRVFHNQQRFDDAIREYREALRHDLTLIDAAVALEAAYKAKDSQTGSQEAYHLLRANKLPEAQAAAEAVLRKDPDHALAHLVLGQVADKGGQYPAAVREYHEALRLDPTLEQAWAGLRRVLEAMPNKRPTGTIVEEAHQRLQMGDLRTAEEDAREVLARAPENVPAIYVLARVLESRGRYAAAIEQYSEVLHLDPRHATAEADRDRARALLATERAYHFLSRRDFLQARDQAREAIRLQPKRAMAHAILGNALLWLGSGDEAEREIQEAQKLQQAEAPGMELGLVHTERGTRYWFQAEPRYLDADDKLRRSRKLTREVEDLLNEAQRLFEQAQAEFKAAQSADPGDLITHNDLGAVYSMLAGIRFERLRYSGRKEYEKADDALALYDRAEDEFKQALLLDDYYVAHYNLGNVYLARANLYRLQSRWQSPGREAKETKEKAEQLWSDAGKEFQQAVELYPANSASRAQLAAVFLAQGKIKDALIWARQAREQGLTDHYIYEELRRRRLRV
jgi:tetratricopeptide (TPR) repeat protein